MVMCGQYASYRNAFLFILLLLAYMFVFHGNLLLKVSYYLSHIEVNSRSNYTIPNFSLF